MKVGSRSQARGRGKGRGKNKKGPDTVEERADHTLHFYPIDEALSALQKAVRRGHARNAAFWAGELHVSGLTAIALRRLHIMTVEDIGIASPYSPFVAAAARSLLLGMPEDEEMPDDGLEESDVGVPPRLVMVCGLARWVASLPKTRTSNQLPSFLRAKAEERERTAGGLVPSTTEEFGAALTLLYACPVANPTAWRSSMLDRPESEELDANQIFLSLETDVMMKAYAYQVCQVNESASLQPLFEELCRRMLMEEHRLKRWMQNESEPHRCVWTCGCSESTEALIVTVGDIVSGFSSVRKMVVDLQVLSAGALDSAARMVLHQAMLLATRAHFLVREGVVLTPSLVADIATYDLKAASVSAEFNMCCTDVVTRCALCKLYRIDGHALARQNTRCLGRFARTVSQAGLVQLVPLNLEACVRSLVQQNCLHLVPADIFACLRRPAVDPMARYLWIPPYCSDVHTRRGSGWPMNKEWESRIVPQNPGLEDWDAEEVRKTHGVLDSESRRMASQFSRYGLIVSDEYFPGPREPELQLQVQPLSQQKFLADLPVAALDHGEKFVDLRSFPGGYGDSREPLPTLKRVTIGGMSETMSVAVAALNGQEYCQCARWKCYDNPAQPHDPFFTAIKSFKAWSEERSFPTSSDFPAGKLPKTLENNKSSTIKDDPSGKYLTQTEYLREKIEMPVVEAASAAPIDSRPSPVTELHRARMQLVLQRRVASKTPNGALESDAPRWSREPKIKQPPEEVSYLPKQMPEKLPQQSPEQAQSDDAKSTRKTRWGKK